jgi:hypothetical protein
MSIKKYLDVTKNLVEKQTDPQKKMMLENYEALLVRAGSSANTVASFGVTVSAD